jgi:WD40 repeat protein
MPDDTSRILDAAISPDGSFAVAVGEKGKHGWLLGIDIAAKSAVWNHEVDDLQQITKVAFSADGSRIYARGSDSTLSIIDRAAGGISDRWQPKKDNPSTYRVQAIQDVAVSPDARAVAAAVSGTVYIWDAGTGKRLYRGASEHKLISSVTFSSDSNYIATADGRQGGKIRVIEVPDK